jgi:hypothetical protein
MQVYGAPQYANEGIVSRDGAMGEARNMMIMVNPLLTTIMASWSVRNGMMWMTIRKGVNVGMVEGFFDGDENVELRLTADVGPTQSPKLVKSSVTILYKPERRSLH